MINILIRGQFVFFVSSNIIYYVHYYLKINFTYISFCLFREGFHMPRFLDIRFYDLIISEM